MAAKEVSSETKVPQSHPRGVPNRMLLCVPKKYTSLKSKILVLRTDQSVKLVPFVRQAST